MVNFDDGIVALGECMDFFGQSGLHLCIRHGKNVWHNKVKNQVCMQWSCCDAEVVDGETTVDGCGEGFYLGTQCGGALVVNHGVHVDDGVDVVHTFEFTFDVVDDVVNLHKISVCGDFGMKRHHRTARAVIVVDEVVDADDIGVGEDDAVNVQCQFGVHWATEERIKGIFGGLPARFEDECGDEQTRQCIDVQV